MGGEDGPAGDEDGTGFPPPQRTIQDIQETTITTRSGRTSERKWQVVGGGGAQGSENL